jgi:hypothetical protein
MPLHHNVAGVWKGNVTLWANVAGVWKRVTLWKNVATVWKQITSLITAQAVSAGDFATSPANAVASISFNSSGTQTRVGTSGTAGFTWLPAGSAAADYEIRVTGTGTTPTGSLLNTWLNLGTTRTWTITDATTAGGPVSFSGTYEIGAAGANSAMTSASFGLTALKESGA